MSFDLKKYMEMPMVASKHGQDVDSLMVWVHWLMIALFIGWIVYFFYALYRFRVTKNPRADHIGVKSHASNYIEGAVIIAEAVLLFGLAIPLWAKAVDRFPKENESTVIRVTAQQFNWNSRYPGADGKFGSQSFSLVSTTNNFGIDYNDPASADDIVPPLGDIHAPVGKPVIVHLSSLDVIHSFKILPLRVTLDAFPGMRIPLHFTPTKVGQYQIQCAQLCGNGHSSMKGFFTVDTQEAFDAWVVEKAATSAAPGGFE